MTTGQVHDLMLLNSMIKWSLLPMIVVLIIAIAQYTVYQPWWRDPIGFTIVFLEMVILAQVVPQDYAQFFVHSVSGTLTVGFIAVYLSMLITLGLVARIVVWGIEWRKAGLRARYRKAKKPDPEEPTPGS